MDSFKTIIAVAVVLSLAFLGVIFAISQDAINNIVIPDIERGEVNAKAPVTDSHNADYQITLSDSKVLYIQSNQTLYESIEAGKFYVFTCRIDFNSHILLVDGASLANRTAT